MLHATICAELEAVKHFAKGFQKVQGPLSMPNGGLGFKLDEIRARDEVPTAALVSCAIIG